ncbi:hypothetical protein [Rhizomicrobium palustre]|uniref:hypothetical protein n=1 Tax=Rhizomicrobium palustre TaxID=189966 RepID=UPI001423F3CF
MPNTRDKHSFSSEGQKKPRATIKLGKYTVPMPGTRRQRVVLGSGLVVGGCLGFLPILGFWMIPLGLVVLSVDSPKVRRLRRRSEIRYGKWRKNRKAKSQPHTEK